MLTVLGVVHRTLLIRPGAGLDLTLAAVFAAAFGLLPWQGSLAVWHTGQWPAFWREEFPPIGAAVLVGNLCAWLLSQWFGPRITAPVAGNNHCLRILFLNQYYAPDMAPTGQVLHELARKMVAAGHTVEIICSCRSYDGGALYPAHETRDGVRIQRLRAFGFGRRGFLGKLADYASFYGLLMLALIRLRRRPDVICALTTPPYIGVLARCAAVWQRCRHMHWVMDLYTTTGDRVSVRYPGFYNPGLFL